MAARPTNSKSYFLMGDLSVANTTLALFSNNQLKQKWSYQNQKINNFSPALQKVLTEIKQNCNAEITAI